MNCGNVGFFVTGLGLIAGCVAEFQGDCETLEIVCEILHMYHVPEGGQRAFFSIVKGPVIKKSIKDKCFWVMS